MNAALRGRIALHLLVEPATAATAEVAAGADPGEVARRVGSRHQPAVSSDQLEEAVERQLERARGAGVTAAIPGDDIWPSQLSDLADAEPLLLWVRSAEPETLRSGLLRSVSVVGARACSSYGRRQAEELGAGLGLLGWTVVSGGAFGIDAAAHQGALSVGARTVLVSAGGVENPYPKAHEPLFARAASNGAVVSEYPLGSAPARHRFVTRNRVIAALSRGTVVVEAARRSGALATVAAAASLNRHVMALPGPVDSDLSVGCHRMIREGQAVLVAGPADVVELVSPLGADPDALRGHDVLAILATRREVSEAALSRELRVDPAHLVAQLAALEGAGLVARRPGGSWEMTAAALLRFAAAG